MTRVRSKPALLLVRHWRPLATHGHYTESACTLVWPFGGHRACSLGDNVSGRDGALLAPGGTQVTRRYRRRQRRLAALTAPDVLVSARNRFANTSGDLIDDGLNPAVRHAPQQAGPLVPHRLTKDPLWSKLYMFAVIAVVLVAVGVVVGIAIHETWAV